jgi:serine/threonine protein kinase
MVRENDIETTEKGIQYKYLKLLGEGTFGQAWKAKNTTTGEFVVIKVYKNRSDVRKILNIEKNALKYLTSKSNLCKEWAVCYKDAFNIKGIPRLVMEFINGSSLTDIISNNSLHKRQLDLQLLDLIIGLNELHKAGITHQDIKEDNIMWDNDNGKYIFLDWGGGCVRNKYCNKSGLSKLFYGNICDKPCGYVGTRYATPPEMLNKSVFQDHSFIDTKAHDIWSIGVVLYDWYVFGGNNPTKKQPFDVSYLAEYEIGDTENRYLSKYPINELHEKIEKLKITPFVKTILKMLLDTKEKRLDNWNTVVELVTNTPLTEATKEVDELKRQQLINLNEINRKKQEALRLKPCGTEEVAIFNTENGKNYCITYDELKEYLNEMDAKGKYLNILHANYNESTDVIEEIIFTSPYSFDIITIDDPNLIQIIF